MHYIHTQGFAHRDLKPENILITEDLQVKVVDFGFGCSLTGRDNMGLNKTMRGTQPYMAPEIITQQEYRGYEVDLFSLGVILFYMRVGQLPFERADPTNNGRFKRIAEFQLTKVWAEHSALNISEELKDLINSMLRCDPCLRPSIVEIVGHPWLISVQNAT